jgi:predicted RNA-binding Zn-ribbon protein involved in translation (DUF1610 family)
MLRVTEEMVGVALVIECHNCGRRFKAEVSPVEYVCPECGWRETARRVERWWRLNRLGPPPPR